MKTKILGHLLHIELMKLLKTLKSVTGITYPQDPILLTVLQDTRNSAACQQTNSG